jgi:hypothetical protein
VKEVEIIDRAIKKLYGITGIEIEYKRAPGIKEFDGKIIIKASPKIILNVESKNEIRESHVSFLIKESHKHKNFIVICRYIPMPVKNILQKEKINYLETSGNCYIKQKNFFLHINDQKVSAERETGKSKIWNPAGLRFVFAILNTPDLLNQPYRAIAGKAAIGLGTVGKLIEDFKKEGFVKEGKIKEKAILFLERRNELINKWVTIYNTVLRPKQIAGTFRTTGNIILKNTNLPKGVLWGGEMAGAKLTKYLKPENYELYTSLPKSEVLKLLKIVPDINGNIELLNIFWNDEIAFQNSSNEMQVVPPLVAYADLLASHDSRNYETAERIKQKYLEK